MVASDLGNDGGGGNFLDEQIGFLKCSSTRSQGCMSKKVDGAVDDNFVKRDFGLENLFDGAIGSEAERIAKAVLVDFGGGDPTEPSSGGIS